MMFDWTAYKAQLTKIIPSFAKLTPDSLKGYQVLSDANKANSKLGEKTRQLISIAVAVTTRCDGCITFHSEALRGPCLWRMASGTPSLPTSWTRPERASTLCSDEVMHSSRPIFTHSALLAPCGGPNTIDDPS